MQKNIGILLWSLFLLSPCFTTNTLDYFVGTDLLAFSLALAAAAFMFIYEHPKPKSSRSFYWLILMLTPAFLILTIGDARNPWGVYKLSAYIIAAYLIFRMSQGHANQLIHSISWTVLLAIVINFYAFVAISQTFHLFQEDQHSLFAIFSYATRFSGPLLQPNLTCLFLNIAIITILSQASHNAYKIIWFISIILPSALIISSNSRSGLLILLFILLAFLIFSQNKKTYILRITPIFATAFSIAFLWNLTLQQANIAEPVIASRLVSVGLIDHLNLWYSSIHLFLEHPLLGVGYGNLASYFAEAQAYIHINHPKFPTMAAATYWSHNLILQFFAEGGGLAGVGILFFLIYIAKHNITLLFQKCNTSSIHFAPMLVVSVILVHGMVSISIFQGFFLCLLSLYLAALFPSLPNKNEKHLTIKRYSPIFFLPALYFFVTFYQFVNIQADIRSVFDEAPDQPQFISNTAKAIDNPWLARSGLEYLFTNMALTTNSAQRWIDSYPFLYHWWLLSQDPSSLHYLILYAKLTNNHLLEAYWQKLYDNAFNPDIYNLKNKLPDY